MTGSCARRAVCTRCCIHSTSNRSRRRSEQDSSALEPRILWSMWLRFIPSCTDYGRSVKVEMSLRRKKEVSSMQVMACAKWPHSHAMGTNNRVIQINSTKVKNRLESRQRSKAHRTPARFPRPTGESPPQGVCVPDRTSSTTPRVHAGAGKDIDTPNGARGSWIDPRGSICTDVRTRR